MKKILTLAAVSSLAIGLAACHSTKNANQAPAATTTENAPVNTAKTYPMGQKSGLTGTNVNGGGMTGGRYVNPQTAPSHQVYYFAFDQSTVSPEYTKDITRQANYLVTHRAAIVRLEGNTDDRGSREYNVGLGWRRAKAVRAILMQQGVNQGQIKMVSYGKEHPAVNGDSEAAWSLNRRVELIYVKE